MVQQFTEGGSLHLRTRFWIYPLWNFGRFRNYTWLNGICYYFWVPKPNIWETFVDFSMILRFLSTNSCLFFYQKNRKESLESDFGNISSEFWILSKLPLPRTQATFHISVPHSHSSSNTSANISLQFLSDMKILLTYLDGSCHHQKCIWQIDGKQWYSQN